MNFAGYSAMACMVCQGGKGKFICDDCAKKQEEKESAPIISERVQK